MTNKEIEIMLSSSGIPFCYHHWEKEYVPNLPYGCFLFPNSHNFQADGVVYHTANVVQIELYTKLKSPQIEAQFEAVLDEAELYYEKSESYIESEKMYQIIYEMEI